MTKKPAAPKKKEIPGPLIMAVCAIATINAQQWYAVHGYIATPEQEPELMRPVFVAEPEKTATLSAESFGLVHSAYWNRIDKVSCNANGCNPLDQAFMTGFTLLAEPGIALGTITGLQARAKAAALK